MAAWDAIIAVQAARCFGRLEPISAGHDLKTMHVVLSTALELAIFAGGLSTMALGLKRARAVRASRNWPVVEGKVISSTVRKRITGAGAHAPGIHPFLPEIVYRYRVDGREYESQVLYMGGRIRQSMRQAHEEVARYPSGSIVPVRYAPENPARACLQPTGGACWLLAATGMAAAVVGTLLLAGVADVGALIG